MSASVATFSTSLASIFHKYNKHSTVTRDRIPAIWLGCNYNSSQYKQWYTYVPSPSRLLRRSGYAKLWQVMGVVLVIHFLHLRLPLLHYLKLKYPDESLSQISFIIINRVNNKLPWVEWTPNLWELEGVVFVSLDTGPLKIGFTTAYRNKSSYSLSKLDVIELPRSSDTSSGEEGSLLTLSMFDKQTNFEFWNLKGESGNIKYCVCAIIKGLTTWNCWVARKLDYVSNLLVFLHQFYFWTWWYSSSRHPFCSFKGCPLDRKKFQTLLP